MAENLRIEVVYALPDRQEVVSLHMPPGSTAEQAIMASGLLAKYPEIDLARNRIGIYSRLVKPDALLRDRDRVEIYRPLLADPKEVRKQRAAEGKAMKKVAASQTQARKVGFGATPKGILRSRIMLFWK